MDIMSEFDLDRRPTKTQDTMFKTHLEVCYDKHICFVLFSVAQLLFNPPQDHHSCERAGTWKPALVQSTLSGERILACFSFVLRQWNDFKVKCWHMLSMAWSVGKATRLLSAHEDIPELLLSSWLFTHCIDFKTRTAMSMLVCGDDGKLRLNN